MHASGRVTKWQPRTRVATRLRHTRPCTACTTPSAPIEVRATPHKRRPSARQGTAMLHHCMPTACWHKG